VQSFHGVVKPLGETRPAWKVLRVLANLLGLGGFGFETSDEVRAEALGDGGAISARLAAPSAAAEGRIALPARAAGNGLERIADVPIYATDPIVRRAPALQLTTDARSPVAGIPNELAAERGIVDGTRVRLSSASGAVVLHARIDPSLAANVVRVPAAHPLTVPLGPMNGRLELAVEREASGATLSSVA
jgi:NADH-quinone oxidoreductase subunit G